MSAVLVRAFVTALRTPRGAVAQLGAAGGARVTVRVQFEPLWDAIAADVRTDEPIEAIVRATLDRFGLGGAPVTDFMVKLHGWEVKGTDATIASSGATDGSTLLVQYRYRRASR